MKKYFLISVVLMIFHCLYGCAVAADSNGVAGRSFYRTAIQSTGTKGVNDQILRLAFAPCSGKGCGVKVQLLAGPKLLSELPLHWPASSPKAYEFPADRWYGAGDPLGTRAFPSWALGDSEQNAMVVSVQTVKLSSTVSGAIIHQTAGFEHLRRHHELFVAKGRLLKSVWKRTEAQGPSWSNVIATPVAGEFVYIEGFQPNSNDRADRVSVRYLRWQEEKGQIREVKQGNTPLYIVSVSPFEHIETARKFMWDHTGCLGSGFMVLERQSKAPSRIIIGAITTDKALADQQVQKLTQCVSGKRLEIVNFK